MKNLFLKILKIWFGLPEGIRFILVGGYNTVFAYIVFAFLYFLTHSILSQSMILFISYGIGLIHNWLTFRFFVFQKMKKRKGILKEFFQTILVYLFVFILNAFLLDTLVKWVFHQVYIAQAICILVMPIVTYLLFKFVVFHSTDN